MEQLSKGQYEEWLKQAEVLEKDRFGEKVLRLRDGTFLKLFRRKRWFSKNLLVPPAKRFANNASALASLGIPCPKVLRLYRMNDPYRSVVHYEPLAGSTLRELLKEESSLNQPELIARLVEFITSLHEHGVYFRSLHMGNIVLTPKNELGLIDISDMRIFHKPLSRQMRKRNYYHLTRYIDDIERLEPGVADLLLNIG